MENSEKELEKQIALNEGFKEANVALSESLVALTAEIKEIKEKKPDVSIESIASLNEKIASQDKLVKELSEKLDAVKEAADADVALGGDESKLVFEKFGGKTNIFKE